MLCLYICIQQASIYSIIGDIPGYAIICNFLCDYAIFYIYAKNLVILEYISIHFSIFPHFLHYFEFIFHSNSFRNSPFSPISFIFNNLHLVSFLIQSCIIFDTILYHFCHNPVALLRIFVALLRLVLTIREI